MGLKTLFIITVSTARMIFPNIPILPGVQPGDLPTETKAISRSVSMTLTSDKRTSQIPSVKVTVPEGLKVGPSVKLIVQHPKPVDNTAPKPVDSSKFVSKAYWGSSETVQSGQPRVEEVSAATNAPQTGSLAYWPIGYYNEKVAGPDSKVAGNYTLTTNYCGATSATLGAEQSYLEPINLLGLPEQLDPAKPLMIKWTKVPRALGYIVNAIGGNDKQTVTWTSGSDPSLAFDVESSPVTKEMLAGYLSKKILLSPDVTSCTMPSGIFKDANSVVLSVTAIGADNIQPGADMDTHVLVRSTASIPITISVPVQILK